MGYELYGSCAVNLAKSLKAYEPSVLIHLVHDDKGIAHLNEQERALFDSYSIADAEDYMIDGKPQYQRMKLAVYKYSPFEETLYIDVDSLWFPEKSVNDLMDHLSAYQFYIGKNSEHDPAVKYSHSGYTYWENPNKIAAYFKLKNIIPQTMSGLFWFKKCDWCKRLFDRCLEVYNDRFAPCRKWANGKPDEYCFNVALCELGYKQKNVHLFYFDKINGVIDRKIIEKNFWGMAAGGNKLADPTRSLYNDLVRMFNKMMDTGAERLHVDKVAVIRERRVF